jgi:protein XRP2
MAQTDPCCPTDVLPTAGVTYTRQAELTYIVGGADNQRGIVYAGDIFGHTPNAFIVCDRLAALGFLVIMPDLFQGAGWDIADFPPKAGRDAPEFQAFLNGLAYGRFKAKIERAVAELKGRGVTSVGMAGFCFGARLAMSALNDGLVASAALVHPAFLTNEDAANAAGPVCFLPSKDEAPMADAFIAALQTSATAAQCVTQRFDDIPHGWMAARGDFSDALNRQRCNEGLVILGKFFHDTL